MVAVQAGDVILLDDAIHFSSWTGDKSNVKRQPMRREKLDQNWTTAAQKPKKWFDGFMKTGERFMEKRSKKSSALGDRGRERHE